MGKKKHSKKEKKRSREEKCEAESGSPAHKKLNSAALKPALLPEIIKQTGKDDVSIKPTEAPATKKNGLLIKSPKSLSPDLPVLPDAESSSTPKSKLSKKAKRKLTKVAQAESHSGSDSKSPDILNDGIILSSESPRSVETKPEASESMTSSTKNSDLILNPVSAKVSVDCLQGTVAISNSQRNRLIDPKDQLISSLKESVSRLTEENRKLFNELSTLKDNTTKLKNGLNCAICLNYYHVPHNLECGHVFCFSCIRNWLNTLASKEEKLRCPLCRFKVEKTPAFVLALHLHLLETLELEESKHPKAIASIKEHMIRYEDESKKWQNIFPDCGIRTSLWDGDDDVARCTTCNWEVVGNNCANCGAAYSGESENEISDSDTGDSEHSSHSCGSDDDNVSEDSDVSNDSFVCQDDEVHFDSDAGSDAEASDTNTSQRFPPTSVVISDDETNVGSGVSDAESQSHTTSVPKHRDSPDFKISRRNLARTIVVSGSEPENSEDEIVPAKKHSRPLIQIQSDSE